MKTGKNLVELAQSLQRTRETSRDFIVPTEKLKAVPTADGVALQFQNGELHQFEMGNYSSGQVASHVKIPMQYFRKIAAENPSLAADNINHGLSRLTNDRQRMLRTAEIDGKPFLRGYLSDKYRRLDSFDLLDTALPLAEKHGLQVVASEITERRMYLKMLSPKLKTEVKKGDLVQYGLLISNSDVGAGSVRIEPLIYRLVCLNGLICDTAFKKYHVGKSQAENDAYELFTEETRNLDDRAFWAKVKDLLEGSLLPENFERQVDRLRVAANEDIRSNDPLRVVELSMKATGIVSEAARDSIVAALASGNQGAGFTRYGLLNSFTAAAQNDAFSFEQSIELERAGGKILTLSNSQWSTIAA